MIKTKQFSIMLATLQNLFQRRSHKIYSGDLVFMSFFVFWLLMLFFLAEDALVLKMNFWIISQTLDRGKILFWLSYGLNHMSSRHSYPTRFHGRVSCYAWRPLHDDKLGLHRELKHTLPRNIVIFWTFPAIAPNVLFLRTKHLPLLEWSPYFYLDILCV